MTCPTPQRNRITTCWTFCNTKPSSPENRSLFSNCVSLIRFSAFVFSFMGQILTGSLLHHTTNPLQKPALSLFDCDKVWHDATLKRKIPGWNGSQGHPVTSRSQKPSQTSHNKQSASVATLIKKQQWDPFLFSSHLHHSLSYDFILHVSFLSCWAGVLNEVTTPAALGSSSKCCLKRAFSPLLSYRPISFTLTLPFSCSVYTSPTPLHLLMCPLSPFNVK